jgi:hypothetical protein
VEHSFFAVEGGQAAGSAGCRPRRDGSEARLRGPVRCWSDRVVSRSPRPPGRLPAGRPARPSVSRPASPLAVHTPRPGLTTANPRVPTLAIPEFRDGPPTGDLECPKQDVVR